MSDLPFIASGLLVGLLVGQTGVGGGSLMTPLLVLVFGIHPASAVGTDLIYASLTKVAGSAVHNHNRTIDWRITGRLAAGSIPGVLLTLAVMTQLDPMSPRTSEIISLTLGVVLIVTAICLVFRRQVLGAIGPALDGLAPRRIAQITVAVGLIVGVLVTITSIGAGAIAVTALFALYPRLPARVIVGSDIVHAVPLTLLAGIGHLALGSVNLHVLVALLCGSVPGVLIGSMLAARVPEAVTRPLLATVLAVVGLRLVI